MFQFREFFTRGKTGRWISGLAALLLLSMVLSWLLVPGWLKTLLIEQTQQQTGRKLELDKLSFSPLQLAVTAEGVRLFEADQKSTALSLHKLTLNLSATSLFHRAAVIDEILLEQPEIFLVRESAGEAGIYNFSDVLNKLAAQPKSDTETRFAISNIQIQGGRIQLNDRVLSKQFVLSDIAIGVPFVSNFPKAIDSFVEPKFQAKLNGAPIDLKARAKPFTKDLDTSLAIDLHALDLAQLVPYLPVALPVQLNSALLDTRLDLSFKQQAHAQIVLSGELGLRQLKLQDKAGADLLQLEAVKTEIRQFDLQKMAADIIRLQLKGPQVWLTMDKKQGLNWANLTQSGAATPSAQKSATKSAKSDAVASQSTALPAILLHQLAIDEGQLHLRDSLHSTTEQALDFSQISLQAQGLSTHKDAAAAKINLQLKGSSGESLQLDAQLQLVSATLNGKLSVDQLALEPYQGFISPYLKATVQGELKAQTQIAWQQGVLSLSAMDAELSRFQIAGKKEDGSIALQSLRLEQLALDTGKRELSVDALRLQGLNTDLRRSKELASGFQNWLVPSQTEGSASPANAAAPGSAWKLAAGRIQLENAALQFQDSSVSPAVKLTTENLNLQVQGWRSDLANAMQFQLQSRLNRKGNLKLNGTSTAQLAQLKLDLDAQGLPVAGLYPYFSSLLNVEITQGVASAKGKLQLARVLDVQPEIRYDGMLGFNDFQIVENGSDEDFLDWKSIVFDGMRVNITAAQQTVDMKQLSLKDFYARAVLSEQGKLNLQNIVVQKTAQSSAEGVTPVVAAAASVAAATQLPTVTAQPVKAAAKSTVKPVIRIGQIAIRGGNVNFTDNFIKPNYKANLTGISGNIGALASDNPQAATVELNGKVDDDAPLLISGTLNPLSEPVFLDIKGSANGIELTRLTPYAAKYAGYVIDKGKLSMQVSYRIENQQLKADNGVTLDQLTFGERVESPSATRLPVMLAVALLRDNDGRIAINLPISGSLSDPQFSVGSIIMKVFVNVLTKAVTSPFALLGSMFGGGEELAYVEFEAGAASLTPTVTGKLDQLAKALMNRQALKLDIIGRVDPETDAAGMRSRKLATRLQHAKWREVLKKDKSVKLSEVSLDANERQRYLQALYDVAKFDKPKNMLGLSKSLPAAEMEAMLLSHTEIDDEDMRELAQKRADLVRDYLEDVAGVPRERLFLIAPKLKVESIKDKGSAARVDFSLK
ncbi:DUF748 domain-containing protein [Undibacterium crateris]|uniref:DUF748 domain-containing protein n=1 Tax=Undibacterium crateris TaxID=2528175 RepID=UPI001389530A|nr:DUF748 domain-containing protein [Undibacterium crateris]NDI86888.1 DUF748 domain-containing protein [Undibacterium crateris]